MQSAWGDIAERTFQRNPASGCLTLCIGMSPLHFFLSGEKPFNDTLKLHAAPAKPGSGGDTDARCLGQCLRRPTHQPLGAGYRDARRFSSTCPSNATRVSPSPARPTIAQSGRRPIQLPDHQSQPWRLLPELAARSARTAAGGRDCWACRMIRKAGLERGRGALDSPGQGRRHADGHRTDRAHRPSPAAVQLVRKAEQPSQYLRALLLPEIAVISQPASLITAAPAVPGKQQGAYQLSGGEERRALLTRRKTSTGSFSQFEYRLLDESPPATSVTARGQRPRQA